MIVSILHPVHPRSRLKFSSSVLPQEAFLVNLVRRSKLDMSTPSPAATPPSVSTAMAGSTLLASTRASGSMGLPAPRRRGNFHFLCCASANFSLLHVKGARRSPVRSGQSSVAAAESAGLWRIFLCSPLIPVDFSRSSP